jgi:hypothetical protein
VSKLRHCQKQQNVGKNAQTLFPNGHLEVKPWGQKELILLDPDNNLLTFGESLQ